MIFCKSLLKMVVCGKYFQARMQDDENVLFKDSHFIIACVH